MYRIVLAFCFTAFTFVSCSSETVSTIVAPSVETISADGLKQLVDSGEKFVFVDVREPSEIQRDGTLNNYTNIPIGQLEKRISEIPHGNKIVVACEWGARAGRGAALLKKHGYKDVLSAGMNEYRQKGFPLIHPNLSGQ